MYLPNVQSCWLRIPAHSHTRTKKFPENIQINQITSSFSNISYMTNCVCVVFFVIISLTWKLIFHLFVRGFPQSFFIILIKLIWIATDTLSIRFIIVKIEKSMSIKVEQIDDGYRAKKNKPSIETFLFFSHITKKKRRRQKYLFVGREGKKKLSEKKYASSTSKHVITHKVFFLVLFLPNWLLLHFSLRYHVKCVHQKPNFFHQTTANEKRRILFPSTKSLILLSLCCGRRFCKQIFFSICIKRSLLYCTDSIAMNQFLLVSVRSFFSVCLETGWKLILGATHGAHSV